MKSLNDLAELHRLKEIANQEGGNLNLNKLESGFLKFAEHMSSQSLTVRLPQLYEIGKEESKHLNDVFESLNITQRVPKAIDFSGAFNYDATLDTLIFLSPQQIEAGQFSRDRSYLDPLLSQIYEGGAELISDFSLHEAIFGKVNCKSGNLDLKDLTVFPEKFLKGPYTLSINLDTPRNTISNFIELSKTLREFITNPQLNLLDPEKIEKVKKSIELREYMGSLSRYSIPKTQEFEIETNSCVIRNKENTLYFLYNPNQKKNAMVYFGQNPFEGQKVPYNLTILEGDSHQHTLVQLVKIGIFKPSPKVLSQRVNELTKMCRETSQHQHELNGSYQSLKELLGTLEESQEYFSQVLNPDMRREYTANLAPELIEFMVYPGENDPTLHEILPKISWNENIRLYNDTPRFIQTFKENSTRDKKKLLKEIQSNTLFSNQQNNDVNVWLYANHQKLCEKVGINFKILE